MVQLTRKSKENGFNITIHYDKKTRGIGSNGKVPWPRSKKQLDRYKKITTLKNGNKPNAMIIGIKTLTSIPAKSIKFGFPERLTYVLSHDISKPTYFDYIISSSEPIPNGYYGITFCDSFETALNKANDDGAGEIFVNGGQDLYNLALGEYSDYCKKVYVEEMNFPKEYDSDRFFPELPKSFQEISYEEISETTNDNLTISMNFITYENSDFNKRQLE